MTKRNQTSNRKALSPKQQGELLGALKARFEKNMNRHRSLEWAKVQARLEANTEKLRRTLGGALYCNRRYGRVFVGNNGAESYYGSRAFRGWLGV
jgi:hypothetical protein